MMLLREVDIKKTKANARKTLKNYRSLERIVGRSSIDIKSPIISDMPRIPTHGNKIEDAIVQLADAEVEINAIIAALKALSLISRQVLLYSFCSKEIYTNYKISQEMGYSERSIERMKSIALVEFAEAYRNGKLIAYR